MERLQAAINKARAQRGGDAAAAPRQQARTAQTAAAPPAAEAAWAALTPLEVDPKRLLRNRIATLDPGPESAPFDMLRTRMMQQAQQHGWRRVAVVSPHSKCGKSTTTANLAFGLARQPSLRSLVIDFDLRRAGLSALIGHRPAGGMSAVLEGRRDFADEARAYRGNVAFGLNGSDRTVNPSELLQSPQTRVLLDSLAERYAPDIMLFDMPPLLASDDNFGFLQNVDCALIMAAAGQTTVSQIDVAERHVAELTNVMGVVLTKCRYFSGAHAHEYDYY